ncbi:MAG: sulfite exporter TauE/SafE family protein [Bullifex sp.]
MSYTSLPTVILLSFLFALAGFIDSIAGGGGLISLTSLYAAGMPAVNAVSTNKFSMTFGTLFAAGNYARKKKIIWRVAISSVPFALIGSSIGAQLALHYADTLLRYMLLLVLPLLTVLTLRKKGTRQSRLIKERNGLEGFDITAHAYIISAAASFAIGVYDGFFGPGTGTFYTILFSFMGLPLIFSAGTTKILNLASNIAAFVTFLVNGTIVFQVGIPCAVSSVIGNLIGSWYALKKEGKAIKKILIIVIALLYVRILSSFFL